MKDGFSFRPLTSLDRRGGTVEEFDKVALGRKLIIGAVPPINASARIAITLLANGRLKTYTGPSHACLPPIPM